jgi:hypothetical protein
VPFGLGFRCTRRSVSSPHRQWVRKWLDEATTPNSIRATPNAPSSFFQQPHGLIVHLFTLLERHGNARLNCLIQRPTIRRTRAPPDEASP